MLKKIVIGCALSTLTSLAMADDKTYVGGSLSFDLFHQYYSGKNQYGVTGTLFTGIGSTYGSRFYLGKELNLDVGHSSNHPGLGVGVGASLLPGFMFTPNTIGYVRAGIEVNHYNKADTINFNTRLALGLQTKLTNKLDARVEFMPAFSMASSNSAKINGGNTTIGLVYNFN